MKQYEWMVKYTPQTEWIEGRGILFWLAFFFIELGAGMFLASSVFGILWGEFIGWLICAGLGGGLHLLYLGHPFRFYRMVLRPQSSWISRGLIFVGVFLVLGIGHMALSLWATTPIALLVAVNIMAFLTIIYGGFAMNYINGIPLWNTALLPILYVVAGFWGGAELTMGVVLATGGPVELGLGMEELIRLLLVAFVIIVGAYLMGVRYSSVTGTISVREIVLGQWKLLFWTVVVVLGILLPLGVMVGSLATGLELIPRVLLWLSIFLGLLGDLMLRYLILKNGFYSPLVQSSHI